MKMDIIIIISLDATNNSLSDFLRYQHSVNSVRESEFLIPNSFQLFQVRLLDRFFRLSSPSGDSIDADRNRGSDVNVLYWLELEPLMHDQDRLKLLVREVAALERIPRKAKARLGRSFEEANFVSAFLGLKHLLLHGQHDPSLQQKTPSYRIVVKELQEPSPVS